MLPPILPIFPEAPRSILFITVSRIGDTLFATPALRAIAAAWPGAAITVLAHPKRAEVLANFPGVARVGGIDKGRAIWRGRLGVLSRQFDLAFAFGFDEPLVAYALRVARRVVAFRQADERLNSKLFAAVDRPPFQSEHAVRQLLRLPAAVGVATKGLRIGYQPRPAELADALVRWLRVPPRFAYSALAALRMILVRELPPQVDPLTVETLDLLLSWESWARLRREQGLSPARARQVLEASVRRLLA